MIISNRKHSFGAKGATIHTDAFKCIISTAKAGLFKRLSTVINGAIYSTNPIRAMGKILYVNSLDNNSRRAMHDKIVQLLDEYGENGLSLDRAIDKLFSELETTGFVLKTDKMVLP